MMAEQRRIARTRGKSDPIDAAAVAGPRDEPDLPVASHDDVSRELKLLVDRLEDLVTTRTATINRLLWRDHELTPAGHRQQVAEPGQASASPAGPARIGARGRCRSGVAELARHEVAEVVELTGKINVLAKRIETGSSQLTGVGLARRSRQTLRFPRMEMCSHAHHLEDLETPTLPSASSSSHAFVHPSYSPPPSAASTARPHRGRATPRAGPSRPGLPVGLTRKVLLLRLRKGHRVTSAT